MAAHASQQPTEEPGPVTARQHLLRLALVACAVFAMFAVNAATGTPVTGQPSTGQPSTSPSPVGLSDPIPRIAIVYDLGGRGIAGFNELAWEGVKRAAGALGAELKEITAKPDDTDADREQRLKELADARYYPIFAIGSIWAGPVAKVAPKYPGTWFAIVDDGIVDAPNVIGIEFNDGQGSFLVGAAAALTSKTGNVGFVGAVQIPLLQKLQAGFAAGARAARPDVKVQVAYLSQPPDNAGFSDPAKAGKAALGMYDAAAA
jgi:basic membrane protein A